MDHIVGIITNFAKARNEEDFVDRLNFRFTSYLFCFASLLITSKLYLGSPIRCWTPNEFKKGWIQYAHDYCLIENTYYLPMDDPMMPNHQVREDKELQYYQWVQFVLLLQAFCFYLPHTFWRSVNWQSGIPVKAIVDETIKLPLEEGKRNEALVKTTNYIKTSTAYSQSSASKQSNVLMMLFGTVFRSDYMSWMYMLTKVMFLFNICFQMFILHVFLGFTPFNFLDLKMGWNTNWKHTGLFPRSTMCDFEIRTKGNVQRYSVQCVLQLNMFNEKIFLVLYYWLMILFAVTFGNFVKWIVDLWFATNREDFAKKMLSGAGIGRPMPRRGEIEKRPLLAGSTDSNMLELDRLNERNRVEEEAQSYQKFTAMKADRVLLLRLISSNAGDIVASDITAALYRPPVLPAKAKEEKKE